jgi:hypothetical protein
MKAEAHCVDFDSALRRFEADPIYRPRRGILRLSLDALAPRGVREPEQIGEGHFDSKPSTVEDVFDRILCQLVTVVVPWPPVPYQQQQ